MDIDADFLGFGKTGPLNSDAQRILPEHDHAGFLFDPPCEVVESKCQDFSFQVESKLGKHEISDTQCEITDIQPQKLIKAPSPINFEQGVSSDVQILTEILQKHNKMGPTTNRPQEFGFKNGDRWVGATVGNLPDGQGKYWFCPKEK